MGQAAEKVGPLAEKLENEGYAAYVKDSNEQMPVCAWVSGQYGISDVYLGVPAGFVVKMENGRSFYFAGDTALFGDMRLIGEGSPHRVRAEQP